MMNSKAAADKGAERAGRRRERSIWILERKHFAAAACAVHTRRTRQENPKSRSRNDTVVRMPM